MNKVSLDSQIVFTFQCPDEVLKKTLEYCKNICWDNIPNRGLKKESGKSYTGDNHTLSGLDELFDLHQWMEDCLNESRDHIGWRKETVRHLRITQSWINRSDIGQGHHKHIHPLSILSGILYLSKDTSTKFYQKSIYTLPKILAPDSQSKNLEIVSEVDGKPGKLIIFPSSLFHSVDSNLKPYSRFSLAFNSWFRGEIGVIEELAYVPK